MNKILWSSQAVAERFEECIDVMKRLPSSCRLGMSGYWPTIEYSPKELQRQEKKKITRLRPLPDAIDRSEETLRWIIFANEGERNLIWLRASGVSWRGVSRETGFPVSSARRYHQIACEKIASKLNGE